MKTIVSDISMFKKLFGRLRERRALPQQASKTTGLSQKAFVEEIWSSWRYEKPTLRSTNVQGSNWTNAAERVNQLKRRG